MKSIRLFFILPAAIIMLGCDKESIETDYTGLYICETAILESKEMDLNNDGHASIYVLDELSQYSNIAVAMTEGGGVIYPFEKGGNTKISLSIPAQSLRLYDNDEETEMINGIIPQISVSCYINKDGSILIKSVDYSCIMNMIIDDVSGYKLNTHLKDIQLLAIKCERAGMISAVVEADYYDFITHQFYRHMIKLEYNRIKTI